MKRVISSLYKSLFVIQAHWTNTCLQIMCWQRRPRPVCISTEPDQGRQCPLIGLLHRIVGCVKNNKDTDDTVWFGRMICTYFVNAFRGGNSVKMVSLPSEEGVYSKRKKATYIIVENVPNVPLKHLSLDAAHLYIMELHGGLIIRYVLPHEYS